MNAVNKMLLESLVEEYNVISKRIKELSNFHKLIDWDDETERATQKRRHLSWLISKYKKELSKIGLEILNFQYKDGPKTLNFEPFEKHLRRETDTNYMM